MNDLLDLMNNNKGEVNFELIATIFVFLMGWSFRLKQVFTNVIGHPHYSYKYFNKLFLCLSINSSIGEYAMLC